MKKKPFWKVADHFKRSLCEKIERKTVLELEKDDENVKKGSQGTPITGYETDAGFTLPNSTTQRLSTIKDSPDV